MSDYGRIGDYIGPVAAKKLSAVDIDANSSNQHEFGGNDALRRLLGTGEDRRASQGHGIPTALMYLSDDDAPAVADLETTWYDARRNNPNRSAEWRLYYRDCEPIRMARPGDLMCFGMLRDNRLLIIIAQHDSTAEAQATNGSSASTTNRRARSASTTIRNVSWTPSARRSSKLSASTSKCGMTRISPR